MAVNTTAAMLALSSVKTSFDLIKGLRETLVKPDVNPTEVHARLLEIESLLLDSRKGLQDSMDENAKLQHRIEELERHAAIGEQFTFDDGVFWHQDYPYCPNCWNIDRKPVRLDGPGGMFNTDFQCPFHKSHYYVKRFKQDVSF